MRPTSTDPHVTGYANPQNELINDIERLENEVDEYRRMIRFYNEAVRNGTVSDMPEDKLFEYETAGERLQEALALLQESRMQLTALMAA
jgi:cytosine/adenosine deaminase-related metal-dependent hydrolase